MCVVQKRIGLVLIALVMLQVGCQTRISAPQVVLPLSTEQAVAQAPWRQRLF